METEELERIGMNESGFLPEEGQEIPEAIKDFAWILPVLWKLCLRNGILSRNCVNFNSKKGGFGILICRVDESYRMLIVSVGKKNSIHKDFQKIRLSNGIRVYWDKEMAINDLVLELGF